MNPPADPAQPSPRSLPAGPALLTALLLVTALILLAWQHAKPLNQDEVFVLQTDSVRSVAQLVEVQRHTPISLDPLVYHLLGYAAVRALGPTALAIRLPSLLGYLLMQVCLFSVGRRMGGDRAGLLAAAVPALTATLYYGAEARPYGLLLGLAALLLWSWQRCVRPPHRARTGPLVGLGVALALALNTHYFAVLLLIPLCAAELFRIARMRRMDWPVAAAIIAGTACIAFTLPFQRAAGEYRTHYYNAGQVGLHAITQAYRALVVNYTHYSPSAQHLWMAALLLAAAALAVAVWRRLRSGNPGAQPAETVFLVVLSALPFFGFLLGRFVTHSIEVRYVLPAILGVAVLTALAVEPFLHTRAAFRSVMVVLLVAIVAAGAARVRNERLRRDRSAAELDVSAAVQDRLDAGESLYVQNLGRFEEALPRTGAGTRSRLVLLYSAPEELKWLRHDTAARTAFNMSHFTGVSTARYDDLERGGRTHLFVLYPPGGWDWLSDAVTGADADLQWVGRALGGDVYAVRLPEPEH